MKESSKYKLPKYFLDKCLLDEEPFSMIDVGCLGGINREWDCFGDTIIAHGFDPKLSEVTRLNAAEARPNVEYHGAWVCLDEKHPFMQRKLENEKGTSKYYDSIRSQVRSSGRWVMTNMSQSEYNDYTPPAAFSGEGFN